MEKDKVKKIYHIFNFIGALISAFIIGLFSGESEFHNEIGFPCARGNYALCETSDWVFVAYILKNSILPLGCFLLVYYLFWAISKTYFSRWNWLPISVLGSATTYFFVILIKSGKLSPILLFVLILLPVMGFTAILAFFTEKIISVRNSKKE